MRLNKKKVTFIKFELDGCTDTVGRPWEWKSYFYSGIQCLPVLSVLINQQSINCFWYNMHYMMLTISHVYWIIRTCAVLYNRPQKIGFPLPPGLFSRMRPQLAAHHPTESQSTVRRIHEDVMLMYFHISNILCHTFRSQTIKHKVLPYLVHL